MKDFMQNGRCPSLHDLVAELKLQRNVKRQKECDPHEGIFRPWDSGYR